LSGEGLVDLGKVGNWPAGCFWLKVHPQQQIVEAYRPQTTLLQTLEEVAVL